jgi:hypothetical protein
VDSLLRLITALDFEIDNFARLVRGRLHVDPGYLAIQRIAGAGPLLGAVGPARSSRSRRFNLCSIAPGLNVPDRGAASSMASGSPSSRATRSATTRPFCSVRVTRDDRCGTLGEQRHRLDSGYALQRRSAARTGRMGARRRAQGITDAFRHAELLEAYERLAIVPDVLVCDRHGRHIRVGSGWPRTWECCSTTRRLGSSTSAFGWSGHTDTY